MTQLARPEIGFDLPPRPLLERGFSVMYQSQFGLSRRPFSSTPDPTCVVPVGGMPEAISELEHCAQDGQGIGILTAPAGLGKTILCRKLAESLREQFAVVFLPNANFPTRRSLLQAMLYEMGHPYLRLGEQELRLEFTTAVRDLYPDREGLVVIVDEAHLLHNRLLEELRTATHLVHQGEMLVRLILSGQLELEERLVKKDLAAINQRIVCHTTLSSLTMLESEEYLQQRLDWAGGNLGDIFDPEAVRLICQASDGNPRCLNQLADHCLMLAGAGQEAQVTPAHVVEALEELKQLPLHWNHVEVSKRSAGNAASIVEIVEEASETSLDEHEPETACIEFGADAEENLAEEMEHEIELSEFDAFDSTNACATWGSNSAAFAWDAELAEVADAAGTMETAAVEENTEGLHVEPAAETSESVVEAEAAAGRVPAKSSPTFTEEVVIDHYARLDNGLPAEIAHPEPRDWDAFDPVAELRAEEDRFAVPHVSSDSEITIINAIPEPGEEWQPEDLPRPKRPMLSSDPSELIEEIMPLIDAALDGNLSDTEFEERLSGLQKPKTPAPDVPSDALGETFLAEAFVSGDWNAVDEEVNLILNPILPAEDGAAKELPNYFLMDCAEAVPCELEERIAQLVLDTYNEVQPLIWNSTTENESAVEPFPAVAGEEPIRDPGDATAFEELRTSLEEAVEATEVTEEETPEEPPAVAGDSPSDVSEPSAMEMEFDIVLPETDEDTPPSGPVSRTDVATPDAPESHTAQRPYKSLFSKIRRKEQA